MLLSTYQPEAHGSCSCRSPSICWAGSANVAEAANRGLRVRYTLVSHPEHPLEGWLQRLAEQATRTADGKNVVLGTAIVGDDLPLKKEGAIAQVVLECGRVPAIWLITRDAYWACYTRLKMLL